MKKNFLRLIIFFAAFFVADVCVSAVLALLYSNINTGPGRYNYISENQFDLLIMGSSTSTSYYSDIITPKTGLSTLNIGLDGSSLIYSRCLLELVIESNVKPGFIILNIDLFEFLSSAWSGNYYSRIEQLNPLYGRVKYIDRALLKGENLSILKFCISSYKYNDLLFSMINKNLDNKRVYKRTHAPHSTLALPVDSKTIASKFDSKYEIDERKIALIKDFINVCKKEHIRLFFIESPVFYPDRKMTDRDKRIEKLIDKISQEREIPFWKITQDNYPVFHTNLFFKDVLHLNDNGSRVFSEIVCNKILESNL